MTALERFPNAERGTGATTSGMAEVDTDPENLDVYSDEYVQLALYALMKNICGENSRDSSNEDISACTPSSPVDIDDIFQYKLEQAADLIKTHLLYAVREEVDAMRGKLCDLESKIYRLEKENTLLLKEYVPADILERMRAEMSDRYKRRRSSAFCQQQQQQQLAQTQLFSGAHSLTVPDVNTSANQQYDTKNMNARKSLSPSASSAALVNECI